MRAILVASLMGLSSAAAADIVTVGSKGGLFCSDPEQMMAIVMATLTKTKQPAMDSCRVMSPGTKLDAQKVEKLDADITLGIGKIVGSAVENDTGAFMLVSTAPEPPPAHNRSFKRVSPNDVRNSPDKWQGRDIEFVDVQVYWVSSDDVRVLTKTNVTLFAGKTRSADNSYFSSACETEDDATSRKCRATVRFRYHAYGEDNPSGILKRTVLRSDDVEIIKPAARR